MIVYRSIDHVLDLTHLLFTLSQLVFVLSDHLLLDFTLPLHLLETTVLLGCVFPPPTFL